MCNCGFNSGVIPSVRLTSTIEDISVNFCSIRSGGLNPYRRCRSIGGHIEFILKNFGLIAIGSNCNRLGIIGSTGKVTIMHSAVCSGNIDSCGCNGGGCRESDAGNLDIRCGNGDSIPGIIYCYSRLCGPLALPDNINPGHIDGDDGSG